MVCRVVLCCVVCVPVCDVAHIGILKALSDVSVSCRWHLQVVQGERPEERVQVGSQLRPHLSSFTMKAAHTTAHRAGWVIVSDKGVHLLERKQNLFSLPNEKGKEKEKEKEGRKEGRKKRR